MSAIVSEPTFTARSEPAPAEAPAAAAHSPARPAGGLLKKGFWAVADQGLFAGSNCIVNVMLANWLSPEDYGAFSTAFAAFLLLGVIHTAMLTEPMLVFAGDKFKGRLRQYMGALLRGHLLLSSLASLALIATGMILRFKGQIPLANAMFCFAGSAPFVLFLWLMRRACYAQMNPRRAALAGIGYLVLMMTALAIVHSLHLLGIGTALTMLAGSSLIAGLALSLGTVQFTRLPRKLVREVTANHWTYGRWATATALLGFVPGNVYYFLLPKLATLEQSGALRALTNLFNPFLQANAALCLLLLPAFVRTRGTAEGKRVHGLALLVLAGGPLIYWLILGFGHKQVMDLVYHGKYQAYSGLIWIIGMQPVIAGMSGVYGSLLRANQKMNAVFWGGFVAAAAAVSMGVWMTMKYGMTGVALSIVLTYAVHHITLWLFSRKTVSGMIGQRLESAGVAKAEISVEAEMS
jgi:O-antigen/teichoic acid export membrane protein